MTLESQVPVPTEPAPPAEPAVTLAPTAEPAVTPPSPAEPAVTPPSPAEPAVTPPSPAEPAVTTTVEASPDASWPAPDRRLWRLARGLGRAVPWSLAAAALVFGLLSADVPGVDVARFAAYWLLALVLPGTLVYRAVVGSRGNWPEDLGYGAATGLVLEIVAWAATTASGTMQLLRFWPVPVVVAFLAIRPLRRHWRVPEPRPLPVAWSFSVAAVMIGGSYAIIGVVQDIPLPPTDGAYYQDLFFHLSLVRELMHPMPFEIPQHLGDLISYHYLSHAHMASGAHISGVDPATVLLRLWLIPIVIVDVLVVAALARELTRRTWTGPLAAGLTFVGAPLYFGGPLTPLTVSPISVNSPSMHYLLPPLMLLTALCVNAVRGRPMGLAWPLLGLAAVVCAGAKSSSLPILIAGVMLAIPVAAVVNRRFPWRAAAALGLLLLALGLGFALFVDGDGGAAIQWFSLLQWTEPYRATLGAATTLLLPGPLPLGLQHADPAAWQFVLALVAWFTIAQLPLVIGVGTLGHRATRTDPAAWMLGGGMLAALGAVWALYHVAGSQHYFLRTATPLGILATVWLLAVVTPNRRAILVVCTALAGGGFVAWRLSRSPVDFVRPDPSMPAWLTAAYGPVLWAAVVAAGLVLAWWAIRAVLRAPRGRGWSVALAGLLGLSLGGGLAAVVGVVERRYDASARHASTEPVPGELMIAEMRAAQWLDHHAGADDVLATNVHCLNVRTRPTCDSRAFWVTALTGRRALVESWGYHPESQRANGRWGLSYLRQTPPDLVRFALNERVFTEPSAADIQTLRDRYGVRWLFADTRAGPVSSHLAGLTTARYVDGPVTIYELPG